MTAAMIKLCIRHWQIKGSSQCYLLQASTAQHVVMNIIAQPRPLSYEHHRNNNSKYHSKNYTINAGE